MIIKARGQLTLLLRFLGIGSFWLRRASFLRFNLWSWNVVNINLLFNEWSILRIIGLF